MGSLARKGLVAAAPTPDCPHWYLARTNANQERLARASLKAEGFEVFMPLYAKANHKGEVYAAPLFPSYLFVRVLMGAEGWTKVFSSRGVASVIGQGGRPSMVHDVIIDRVKAREHDGFVRMGLAQGERPKFEKGQKVSVLARTAKVDPIEAIFVEQLDRRRGLILITLLGDKRIANVALDHLR